MSGLRLGGTAFLPTPVGFPITVYSVSDFQYLALGGTNVVLTDKTVDYFDEANNAILSPDNTLIAVNANFPFTGGGFDSGGIAVVPVTGGVPLQVSAYDSGGPWMLHPSWHPDSDTLVYIHADPAEGFDGSIVTAQVSNPGVETVLYTPSTVGAPNGYGPFRPQYSPDGSLILFFLNDESGATDSLSGLYVMDADGSNVTQLDTFNTAGSNDGYAFDGSQACWTPDGRIVYSNANFAGGTLWQIYIIDSDGANKTLLTTDGDTSTQDCLITNRGMSPAGDYAVISSNTTGSDWRPYRLELDGSGATILDATHGPVGADQNFRCVYVHEQRVWFIDKRGTSTANPGTLSSIALDGTDYQIETTLFVDMDGDRFYTGTGIEWI